MTFKNIGCSIWSDTTSDSFAMNPVVGSAFGKRDIMTFTAQRALILYAGALTAAAPVFLLHAAAAPDHQKTDVLDVERINMLQPDRTLRMTISNGSRSPGTEEET